VATKTYDEGLGAKLVGIERDVAIFKLTCSTVFERVCPLEIRGICVFRDDARLEDQSMKTWSFHPLFQEFVNLEPAVLERACSTSKERLRAKELVKVFENVPALVAGTRTCYRLFTKLIASWLEVEKHYSPEEAEKHARAAAGGILGQCVTQELTCSAPVDLWIELAHDLTQPGVDGEVSAIFEQVKDQLF